MDDYKTMLRIIRNLLKQLDIDNVEEATDGQEALAKLRNGNFGLVISDWNMAPMTGLDLLKEVRADARLKHTPFIMITAESKTENVIAAKAAGVSNYIVALPRGDAAREDREGPGACLTAPPSRTRPASRPPCARCSAAWQAT